MITDCRIEKRTMKDATDIVQSYRECVRHLWNANFMSLIPAEELVRFR